MIAPCIRNSVSIVFLFPFFFLVKTIFDRQDSPIFSKSKEGRGGGKKCQNYGKFDNDSKIRSRLQKCIAHGQMRIIDE